MKTPTLDQLDRMMLRHHPHKANSQFMNLKLAILKFKRELYKLFLPVLRLISSIVKH